jgi:hypothetical protein
MLEVDNDGNSAIWGDHVTTKSTAPPPTRERE